MHITTAQLDAFEKALMLQENWDKALEAVKDIRDNVATEPLLKLARDHYSTDDLEIDEDAGTSDNDEGVWVQAWVYVRKPTVECKQCNGHGSVGPTGAAAPEDDRDYYSTFTCGVCAGEGDIRLEFGEDA